MMKRIEIILFFTLLLFNISKGSNSHSHIFVLSSSPSGRFMIIQEKKNKKIYILDIISQDTLRSIYNKTKKFLGWKNDTSFYCINQYNGNKFLEISNVYNHKNLMVKVLNTLEISMVEDSLNATPNAFEKVPFLIFVDSRYEKIYRYDFLSSTLDTLFDLSDYFNGDQTISFISVNSTGKILLNISSNNYNSIYYFPNEKSSEIAVIDSSKDIVFDSYCFFNNSGNELLYYKYHQCNNKILDVYLIKQDLSTGIIKEYKLPSGFVPSNIVDFPNKQLFIVNGVATNSDYTISINTQMETKDLIINLISKYFSDIINNFDIIQIPYCN